MSGTIDTGAAGTVTHDEAAGRCNSRLEGEVDARAPTGIGC